ncbi:unnamed protein product, partial [Brenthis ino]
MYDGNTRTPQVTGNKQDSWAKKYQIKINIQIAFVHVLPDSDGVVARELSSHALRAASDTRYDENTPNGPRSGPECYRNRLPNFAQKQTFNC